MRNLKLLDSFLNIILPILLGISIYLINSLNKVIILIKNFIPDGLWAYALISTILIIWDREINASWILINFLSFFLFELLQHFKIINGTGDYKDIIVYLLFSFLALFTNNHILKLLNKLNEKKH